MLIRKISTHIFLSLLVVCFLVPSSSTANELTVPARNDIVRYLNYFGIVGDGADELLSGALSQASTSRGVVWWDVFGTLLTADSVLSDLSSGDYDEAVTTLAKNTTSGLIKKSSAGSAFSSASSIAALASLPIDLSLNAWADLVSEHGFRYQVGAYSEARTQFSMSHDAIMQQLRPDPTITYDDFGYLRTVGDMSPSWYRASRPDRKMTRMATYELLRVAYEAPELISRVSVERSIAVEEFKLLLMDASIDLNGSWSGYSMAGSTRIDKKMFVELSDNNISGNISLKFPGQTDWKTYTFSGSFSGGRLSFAGETWLTSNNGHFCMASGDLELIQAGTSMTFRGTWGSNSIPGGCPRGSSGPVELVKQ